MSLLVVALQRRKKKLCDKSSGPRKVFRDFKVFNDLKDSNDLKDFRVK